MPQNEQSQSTSLLERLNKVLGNVNDPPRSTSLLSAYQSAGIAQSLKNQYFQALSAYLKEIKVDGLPELHPLRSPFLYLYTDKKAGVVRTISTFPYGSMRYSNQITEKTFPSFLVHACHLTYTKGLAAQTLCQALDRLIRQYPYDRLGYLANLLKHYAPKLFIMSNFQSSFAVTSNGNLCFDQAVISLNDPAHAPRYLRYLPIFLLPDLDHIPQKLSKQFFSELQKRSQSPAQCLLPCIPEYQGCSEEIIYSSAAHNTLTAVHYLSSSNQFIQKAVPRDISCLNLKHLPITRSQPSDQLPSNAMLALSVLCRKDPALLERFAAFLSTVASPTAGGLTVLLSSQNAELLQTMIHQIFFPMFIDLPVPEKSRTLNRLSKKTRHLALYLAQAWGNAAVVIRDTLPSSSNLSVLRRLIKGKSISLPSNCFPTQRYENKLHFICITSSPQKAYLLRDQLKANVIDFSKSETACSGPICFTESDLHWLRTSYLLYGLKLRTCNTQNTVSPPERTVSSDSTDAETLIVSFLRNFCSYQADCFCSTVEVYDCYIRFLSARHGAQVSAPQKRVFNRMLRYYLKTLKKYQNVRYNRNHTSRSLPSLWGYRGLKLPTDSPALPDTQEPKSRDSFQECLAQISECNISFQQINEVHFLPSDHG